MPQNRRVRTSRKVSPARRSSSVRARLAESERLFADFVALTPHRFTPFVKTFDSFAAYERWKRGQKNPWLR